MRKVCAAAIMLLSVDAASASERGAFWDQIAKLDADQSLIAYKAMECSVSAAAALASADQITPARWMAEAAATEAGSQCGVTALDTTVGKDDADRLAATIQRISVERALQVRSGGPKILCAVASHACSMKRMP